MLWAGMSAALGTERNFCCAKKNKQQEEEEMKTLIKLISLFAVLMAASFANAIMITDTVDPADVFMNNDNSIYSYSHSITGPGDSTGPNGFIPGTDVLSNANMAIYLYDNGDGSAENYKINLGLDMFNSSIKITNLSTSSSPYTNTFDVISYLQSDGLLNVTIKRQAGDFYFAKSILDATWTSVGSSPSTVPEPSTMVLLGAGLLVLVIFGKRRMSRA
jgi:hypothetical protein